MLRIPGVKREIFLQELGPKQVCGVEVGGTGRKRLFLVEFSSLGIRSSQKGGIIGLGPRKCCSPYSEKIHFRLEMT